MERQRADEVVNIFSIRPFRRALRRAERAEMDMVLGLGMEGGLGPWPWVSRRLRLGRWRRGALQARAGRSAWGV